MLRIAVAGLAVLLHGLIFLPDASAQVITTIAGRGRVFRADGGPATGASLNQPWGPALDQAGNLYIADAVNHRVRKVSPGGTITTVAGNGTPGFSGDGGPATGAIAVRASGRGGGRGRQPVHRGCVQLARPQGQRQRDHHHGSWRGSASPGDGGPATRAALAGPTGLAVDASDNLYIADTRNHRIRKVNSAGIITTA